MAAEELTPKKPDKNAPKVAEPRFSTRKVKSFVEIDPQTHMRESVDERIDQLIRYGLGDPAKLAFYRAALQNPRESVNSAVYRRYVGDTLANLLQIILSDQSLFLRVRTVLQQRKRQLTHEDVVLAAMELRLENASDLPDPKDVRKKTVHKKHPRPAKDDEV